MDLTRSSIKLIQSVALVIGLLVCASFLTLPELVSKHYFVRAQEEVGQEMAVDSTNPVEPVLGPDEQALPQDSFSAQGNLQVAPTASEEAINVQANLLAIGQKYFEDVENYRDVEDRYLVARETYYQNNTLAAQTEAIRRAKELLQARIQVLDTYFTYLQHALDQTVAINLDNKQLMSTRLGNIRANLEQFEEQAASANDRLAIEAEFNRLNEQENILQSAAFSTLALIKIGEIQDAIDQSLATQGQVTNWLQEAPITEAQQAKKERGLAEIDLLINRAHNNLIEVRDRWKQQTLNTDYREGTYRSFQTAAEYSYLQLRQALSFMNEIIQDVE